MRPISPLLLLFATLLLACETKENTNGSHANAAMEPSDPLIPENLIGLDAEALGEGGVAKAYSELLPKLAEFGVHADPIEEIRDKSIPSYSVRHRGTVYPILYPDSDKSNWGLGTHALFSIVNSQLKSTGVRFYAIHGGNDLSGTFLTDEEFGAARARLKNKTDWPYLPTTDHPWFGQQY